MVLEETKNVNQNNMSQEIKCPQCGGNRVERTGGRYKCMYCGTMFQPIVESPKQEQFAQPESTGNHVPTNTPSNVNVTVNVPNAGGYDNRRNNENTFTKGAAQGAGVVAGGCLTTTAIILAIPFILFLALLSMCSSSM